VPGGMERWIWKLCQDDMLIHICVLCWGVLGIYLVMPVCTASHMMVGYGHANHIFLRLMYGYRVNVCS